VGDPAGVGRDVAAAGVARDGWEELGARASAGLFGGDPGLRALLVAGEDWSAHAVEGDGGAGLVAVGAGGVCGGEEGGDEAGGGARLIIWLFSEDESLARGMDRR